jgi:hypothetical protein
MRIFHLVFVLVVPNWSLAAPVTGLQDTDTFLFGFTQTWSAGYPMEAHDSVEACMVGTDLPSAPVHSRHLALTEADAPCASIGLPGEHVIAVKAYGQDQVRDAFFNKSPTAPKQRSFEARLSAKDINAAYAELLKVTNGKSSTYFLMVAHQSESWGLTLPLATDGSDNSIDPSNLMSDTRGGYTFSNFYAHHVGK